jgi:histidinol-phosphate aminotransferase
MKKTCSASDWIRPELYHFSAYPVPDPGHAIKLDAMENPYTWDAPLVALWLEHLRTVNLNRYPDATAQQVKQHLRSVMQVPQEMDIILGNGSDELIQMLILTLNNPGRVLLVPEPSFIMYRILAQVVGMHYIGVPLHADDFSLDMPAMLAAIKTHQPALIFLAYPNNPTGNSFNLADIENILDAAPGIVVVDEAYAPFAENTWMSRLHDYPNLLIMRTLSKLGLAGLRLGLLAGHPEWLVHINKTRQPYNINTLSQISAVFALQHYALFEAQTRQIKRDRATVFNQLNQLSGIHAWPSQTNFILFRITAAQEIFTQLKERGILIKCVQGRHPLLENCLQVTIGTPAENETFLQTLTSLM